MKTLMRLKNTTSLAFLATALVLVLTVQGDASIIGGSVTGGNSGGVFVELTPPLPNPFGTPNSVGDDTFQSPNLFAFDEDQNILLAAPLTVDVGTSPVPAGTTVASHYIFFDPGPNQSIIGTVDFDSTVLAIMTSTTTLAASDFLANTGVNYLNPGLRGLESGDSATISGAQHITLYVFAGTPGDYIRVLTTFSPGAIPEPSTLALAALALLSLLAHHRRRRA